LADFAEKVFVVIVKGGCV